MKNYFATMFTQEKINDLVIMNDKMCRHLASYNTGEMLASFPDPIMVYKPQTETKRMTVKIFCPICQKSYGEASKRMKKEILLFMSQLSQSSMLDEVIAPDPDDVS